MRAALRTDGGCFGLCLTTAQRAGAQHPAPAPAAGQGRCGERWDGHRSLRSQARSRLQLIHSQDRCFAQALPWPLSPRPSCEALQPQLRPEPHRLRADVPVGARSQQPPPHQRHTAVCWVSLGGDTVPCVQPLGHPCWPSALVKTHGEAWRDTRAHSSRCLWQKQSPCGDRLHPAKWPQPLHSAAPAAPALPADGVLGDRHQRPGHGRVRASVHRPHGRR